MYGTVLSCGSKDTSGRTMARRLPLIFSGEGVPEVTEGSAALYENLTPGKHKVEYRLRTKGGESDAAFLWNGVETKVFDGTGETTLQRSFYPWSEFKTVEVDCPYGVLALFMCDRIDKKGDSELHIASVTLTDELLNPPRPIALVPKGVLGSVTQPTDKKPYLQLSCGSRDVSAKSLDEYLKLGDRVQAVASEGSAATFKVLPGSDVEVVWQFVCGARYEADGLYLVLGKGELTRLGGKDGNMGRLTSSSVISGLRRTTFKCNEDEFSLAILDELSEGKRGSSYARIYGMYVSSEGGSSLGSDLDPKPPTSGLNRETVQSEIERINLLNWAKRRLVHLQGGNEAGYSLLSAHHQERIGATPLVKKAFDFYHARFDEADVGVTRILELPWGDRTLHVIATETDGDDGILEIYESRLADKDAKYVAAAVRYIDVIAWRPIEEIREFVDKGGYYEGITLSDSVWSWTNEAKLEKRIAELRNLSPMPDPLNDGIPMPHLKWLEDKGLWSDEHPGHSLASGWPVEMAVKAYRSFLASSDSSEVDPRTWNQEFYKGYNLKWHGMFPGNGNEYDNRLGKESGKAEELMTSVPLQSIVYWRSLEMVRLLAMLATGEKLPDPKKPDSNNLKASQEAIANLVFLSYRAIAFVGSSNNTDRPSIQEEVWEFGNAVSATIAEADLSALLWLATNSIDELINPTEIYQLWTESWGLD